METTEKIDKYLNEGKYLLSALGDVVIDILQEAILNKKNVKKILKEWQFDDDVIFDDRITVVGNKAMIDVETPGKDVTIIITVTVK